MLLVLINKKYDMSNNLSICTSDNNYGLFCDDVVENCKKDHFLIVSTVHRPHSFTTQNTKDEKGNQVPQSKRGDCNRSETLQDMECGSIDGVGWFELCGVCCEGVPKELAGVVVRRRRNVLRELTKHTQTTV